MGGAKRVSRKQLPFKGIVDWGNKDYVRGFKNGFQRATRYYESMPRTEATDLAKQVMRNEVERSATACLKAHKLYVKREGNDKWQALAKR